MESFYNQKTFDFVCIATKNENFTKMELKYCKGDYKKEFLEYLAEIFETDPKYSDKCMATQYILKNQIMIINDINSVNFPNKKLLKQIIDNNFHSALFIPIYKNGKIDAGIGLCVKYKNYFNKVCLSIFKEIKEDIEYAIKKIEDYTLLDLLKEAIDKTYSWILITDENANILYANKSVEEISGYKAEELLGKNPRIFKSGFHSIRYFKIMWDKLTSNIPVETVIINRKKDGNLFYLKDKIIPVFSHEGKKYYISLGEDITKEKILEEKLKEDFLTKLPNRNEFIYKILNSIDKKETYAFIIIDLKDFKIFNQINGIEQGDYILRKFAEFLKTFFHTEDIIARIGADEFAVFIKYKSLDEILSIIKNFNTKIKTLEEFQNKIAVNIGIALYPNDDTDIVKLLDKAYLALELAKEKGEFTYEFFSSQINEQILKYTQTKNLLKTALKNKEFIYYFQPYVDSKNFKIVGAETLIRIKHNNKIIYPNSFIDYAENSGFIKTIEKQMFPKFLEYLQQINIPLSFNISGKSLTDEEHIKNLFKKIHNLPINIELTEREIAGDIEYTKKIFNYFKNKKFRLSIDDFGTGYSSFSYLKDLPADYLKIDISFVRNIENSKKDYAIVETIIDFAHKFNMKTIAEGVENINQLKLLQNAECDYIQGFYFYKPMPFNEFKSLL
ncbi:GGDEF domain-containing phosphodiesterase [Lebetimonas sp. JH369]|uniref:sensor domain-containing protein n=1 Tax=Lebetimonas sp. JH369 TaxID=990069 RepID=UPI0004643525|nr:GGDEF domain-containing phosphodiesterase [Lebetimonas sp. JH369]